MTTKFFTSKREFTEWLTINSQKEKEVMVGYYKVSTGKPTLSWSDSVDVALCFGWIDSVRKTIDEKSYSIRFSPRRPNSVWSNVNINKVKQLIVDRLMTEDGLIAYNLRKNENSGIYSFEKDNRQLDEQSEELFKGNKPAWDFFMKQAPSYRKTMIHWILSAKQIKTKTNRLEKVILYSEQNKRVF